MSGEISPTRKRRRARECKVCRHRLPPRCKKAVCYDCRPVLKALSMSHEASVPECADPEWLREREEAIRAMALRVTFGLPAKTPA